MNEETKYGSKQKSPPDLPADRQGGDLEGHGQRGTLSRRDFLNSTGRFTLAFGALGLAGLAALNAKAGGTVWQIDPFKCTQCGRCATDCVLSESAVKCIHAYDLCGYCDLCGGYFKPGVTDLNTGAENQLCPTAAIERKFIEEPYFEYIINEELCIGCGKCVKGCTSFGNGSLHLQIRHDLCDNCNECAIARVCPSDAIHRVPASDPYMIKGDFVKEKDGKWENKS
jgi:electron transport complex protein RnfB